MNPAEVREVAAASISLNAAIGKRPVKVMINVHCILRFIDPDTKKIPVWTTIRIVKGFNHTCIPIEPYHLFIQLPNLATRSALHLHTLSGERIFKNQSLPLSPRLLTLTCVPSFHHERKLIRSQLVAQNACTTVYTVRIPQGCQA